MHTYVAKQCMTYFGCLGPLIAGFELRAAQLKSSSFCLHLASLLFLKACFAQLRKL